MEGPPTKRARMDQTITSVSLHMTNALNLHDKGKTELLEAKKFADCLQTNFGEVVEEYHTTVSAVRASLESSTASLALVKQDLVNRSTELENVKSERDAKVVELTELAATHSFALQGKQDVIAARVLEITELNKRIEEHAPIVANLEKERDEAKAEVERVQTELDNQQQEALTKATAELARAQSEAEQNRLSLEEIKKQKIASLAKLDQFNLVVQGFQAQVTEMKTEITQNYEDALVAYQPKELPTDPLMPMADQGSDISVVSSTYTDDSYDFGRGRRKSSVPESFTAWNEGTSYEKFAKVKEYLAQAQMDYEKQGEASLFYGYFYTIVNGKPRGRPLAMINDALNHFFQVKIDGKSATDSGCVIGGKTPEMTNFQRYVSNQISNEAHNKSSYLFKAKVSALANN